MAVLTLTDVQMAVHNLVGTAALLTGRALAQSGRVQKVEVDPSSGNVRAVVRDGKVARQVEVTARYRDNGTFDVDEASCACGAAPCQHVAALILTHFDKPASTAEGKRATRRSRSATIPAPAPAPQPAPWETALTTALAPPPAPVDHGRRHASSIPRPEEPASSAAPPIALQFELVSDPGFRIGVRPVVPGRNGAWVRSNISWYSLGYPEYHMPLVPRSQVRLLRELHALPSAHDHSYRDKVLMLDSIISRRVWDLLREIQETGIPLVMAGRGAAPVHVLTEPVVARVLIRRRETGLVLEPVLEGAGQQVTRGYLPISDPPHGVAWESSPGDGLRLARLSAAPPQLFWQLSQGDIPPIPAADEERFLSEFYPQLSRHLEVVSPDNSLVLPAAQPPVLELTVTPLGDHHMRLDWAWAYRLGATSHHEPLLARPGPLPPGRDLGAETRTLDEIRPLLAEFPDLTQNTISGVIPLSQSEVHGVTTARLMSQTIPLLRDRTDVDVRLAVDQIPDYREIDDAPVFEFVPTDASGGGGANSQQDWFDLAVTITVDGQTVPFNQLFVALAQDETELLLDDGLWFSLDRDEFHQLAALIAESRELLDAPGGTLRLSRFHAGMWDEIERLGVINGQVDGWRESIRALSQAADFPEQKLPSGLEATLRPYQEDGFRWLATLFEHRLGGVLADDMGLGKTVQTLALFLHARENGLTDHPFLVVAPTSVAANWAQEAARFAPGFTVSTITATGARRGHDVAGAAHDADLVITSYTLFRLEFEQYSELQWAGLVLDEAQAVKNYQGAGYRCARELPAAFKLAITGTPMENNLMELWALLSITSPGLFPRPERFTEYYRTPIEREQNPDRLDQLRRRITPLMLRRTKELVAADLPDRQEQVLELELAPRHRKIYQKYLQRERQKVLGLLGDLNRNRFEIFRSLTLLRQATLDVGLVDPAHAGVPSTKLDALMEQLTEIAAEGHRILVFSQFTRFLSRAADRLDQAGIEYCYLDGKTKNRARVVSQFREGTAPVFLISLKAGGTGLNLTEADYVFLLDPWWNPAVEAQAVDRAHRIGQTRNVMVYRLVARDTIEEKVVALKARKSALTNSVLDGEAMGSAALTADDIRGLLD
ncbi:DEAD/DEAH box helicase [Kineosporia mesophila]|uniref:DEAD/DEAH box helicase n=1 Tax=Kineosporia mesophila TaxID=566012 RepID=A0ABP6ZWW1_9ACTN|nr:DEAD/DEAH box helicase [Kineosporia mesophila]MCD5353269.1 DEAD/DEAH box helicase [Kineosporia mesophila]